MSFPTIIVLITIKILVQQTNLSDSSLVLTCFFGLTIRENRIFSTKHLSKARLWIPSSDSHVLLWNSKSIRGKFNRDSRKQKWRLLLSAHKLHGLPFYFCSVFKPILKKVMCSIKVLRSQKSFRLLMIVAKSLVNVRIINFHLWPRTATGQFLVVFLLISYY